MHIILDGRHGTMSEKEIFRIYSSYDENGLITALYQDEAKARLENKFEKDIVKEFSTELSNGEPVDEFYYYCNCISRDKEFIGETLIELISKVANSEDLKLETKTLIAALESKEEYWEDGNRFFKLVDVVY